MEPSQQPDVHASDVTWARFLDILQANSRAAGHLHVGNLSNAVGHGVHAEAMLDFSPSPPSSLARSSPPSPASPRERPSATLDAFVQTSSSSAANRHLPQLQQRPLYHNPQQRSLYQNLQHQHQQQHHLHSVSSSEGSQSRGLLLLGQLSRRMQAAGAAASNTVDTFDLDLSSVSASAERHRLISDTAGVSVQMFVEWAADLIPFLMLLAWVFVFKHAGVLFLVTFLAACTFHANADIRKLIALRREARVAACISQALTVAVFTAGAVACTLPDTRLLRVLTLRGASTAVTSALDMLLLVLLADSVLRFGSLAPKLMVVAWFRSRAVEAPSGSSGGGGGGYLSGARRHRQQSRVLTAVERTVALYRTLVPGPVWYGYLLYGGGFSPILASLFCGFYLMLKVSYVSTQTRMLALALKTATRQGALYGTYVGRPDSGEAGTFGACPVCQDPVSTPVRLDCGHIFCEECILEWLERDRTCPMCRAEVRPAGLPSCSDGASPLLPQVF